MIFNIIFNYLKIFRDSKNCKKVIEDIQNCIKSTKDDGIFKDFPFPGQFNIMDCIKSANFKMYEVESLNIKVIDLDYPYLKRYNLKYNREIKELSFTCSD